jgi:hypothetical protein
MLMDKRNDTQREVLLDVRDEPITSLDELIQQCHRALSAHVWTTCCWSEDGTGWKIGDFNYLVVSVAPDPDTTLYVQFWSEPRERVVTEVGSGESCPGAIRHIGPAEREALEARGYTMGGRARNGGKNYEKELLIDSATGAEAAALDVLRIVFEVFGYRGQWRLEIERHRGERAEHEPVYTSVTPEDFAKVAARAGWDATVRTEADTPFVALRRGRRAFLAVMDWRVMRQNLYSLIALQTELRLKGPVSDEALAEVNAHLRLVKVCRTGNHTVRMHMPLAISGGVTTAWMAQSLQHWMSSWRECERQLRRGVRAQQRRTSPAAELVH